MEFLDQLVIPQPDYNLNLISVLLIAGMMIFLTYSGLLFGSMLLSYLNKPSDNKIGNKSNLAKDYADLAASKFAYIFGLGIVPFLAIIFMYAQLLHGTKSGVIGYLFAAFLLYLIAVILFKNYRNSFHLANIFETIKGNYTGDTNELDSYSDDANASKNGNALYGLIAMFASMWIFVGAVALALDSSKWESVSNIAWLLIDAATLLRFAHFITASLTIAGLAFIFNFFYWDKEVYNQRTDDYKKLAREYSVKTALIFGLFQPVFIVLSLFMTPSGSVNSFVFALSVLSVFAVFMVLNLSYIMFKQNDARHAFSAFMLFVFVFGFMAMKENTAFAVSNKQHVAVLNKEYKEYKEELLASAGRNVEEVVNGEEIYNGRCLACHKFDEKLVGPPHKDVLPKYVDNKEALVNFILNPAKIDPNYPPMPNQGLKRQEAQAVADYMLEHYGPMLK